MGKFDFNKVGDFQKATFSGPATLLQQFSGNTSTPWDLEQATFRDVVFHTIVGSAPYQASVPTVQDTGGRRKAKYLFPYVDGQTTDDLGRTPQTFNFTVVFHGDSYLTGFKLFKKAIDDPTPGLLKHPTMGQSQCVVEDYTIVHQHNARKSLEMRITFTEHNFNVAVLDKQDFTQSTLKAALTRAIQLFNLIERATLAITGAINFSNAVKATLNNLLGDINSNSAIALANINATYNANGSSVDIPGIVPVSQGGTLQTTTINTNTGQQTTATTVAVVTNITSPSDPFSNIPLDQISSIGLAALATETIENQINSIRAQINLFISILIAQGDANAELDLYQTLLDIRAIAILLQQALEAGVASSNAFLIEYVTPRVMSVREVAFVNGIDPDRSIEIELLNKSLQSFNYIDAGTSVQVPAA